mmetsp:Transcript_11610/g.26589  ORF Transcript_11610/g.26589 Transcript_11610/m.26589 type:complete len:246 (-) Transcript_11610:1407-2144(-)
MGRVYVCDQSRWSTCCSVGDSRPSFFEAPRGLLCVLYCGNDFSNSCACRWVDTHQIPGANGSHARFLRVAAVGILRASENTRQSHPRANVAAENTSGCFVWSGWDGYRHVALPVRTLWTNFSTCSGSLRSSHEDGQSLSGQCRRAPGREGGHLRTVPRRRRKVCPHWARNDCSRLHQRCIIFPRCLWPCRLLLFTQNGPSDSSHGTNWKYSCRHGYRKGFGFLCRGSVWLSLGHLGDIWNSNRGC